MDVLFAGDALMRTMLSNAAHVPRLLRSHITAQPALKPPSPSFCDLAHVSRVLISCIRFRAAGTQKPTNDCGARVPECRTQFRSACHLMHPCIILPAVVTTVSRGAAGLSKGLDY